MAWFRPLLAAVCLAATLAPAPAQLSPLEPQKPAASDIAPPTNALDARDLEFYVRHLNVYGPDIHVAVGPYEDSELPGLKKVEVEASYQLQSKKHVFYVSEDGSKIIEGQVYSIDQNPFREANELIDVANAPAFGEAGAPLRIVVYSDFQCPYCAQEATVLRNQVKREYADTGKARVYFRDFPLSRHEWAEPAAVLGRCMYRADPEKFWAYHDWIFENQESITPQNLAEKALAFAAEQGLDKAKLEQCFYGRETEQEVAASVAEGRAAGVTGTPTLFINGRRLGSLKWEQLKAVLDFELDYQKVTHNAGDDCGCTVDLSQPQ